MNKLVPLYVLLAAPFVSTTETKPTQIVIDFCVTTLHQSQNDASSCYNKPQDYDMGDGGDDAILIYLCCLGCFVDVTINYMPFLQDDLVDYISKMTNDKLIPGVAKFVMACKNVSRKLSKAHFLSWTDNGQTGNACPTV